MTAASSYRRYDAHAIKAKADPNRPPLPLCLTIESDRSARIGRGGGSKLLRYGGTLGGRLPYPTTTTTNTTTNTTIDGGDGDSGGPSIARIRWSLSGRGRGRGGIRGPLGGAGTGECRVGMDLNLLASSYSSSTSTSSSFSSPFKSRAYADVDLDEFGNSSASIVCSGTGIAGGLGGGGARIEAVIRRSLAGYASFSSGLRFDIEGGGEGGVG